MSEDGSGQPSKKVPFKLVDLKLPKDDMGQFLNEAASTLDPLQGNSGVDRMMKEMQAHQKHIDALAGPLTGGMKQVFDDIEAQRKRIDAMQAPLGYSKREMPVTSISMPKLAPNPILETNRKLAEIEKQFEQMLAVMSGAAKIANDIQGHAANFLEKFDKASEATDRSAKGAIRIAVVAIIVSVVSPFIPLGIDYFWPDKTLHDLQSLTQQVISTQDADRSDSKQLIQELQQANERTAAQIVGVLGDHTSLPLELFKKP